MKRILTLLLISFSIYGYSQQNLPVGFTEFEKTIWQDYLIETSKNTQNTNPPEFPPRTPGEFEEVGGVIITWTSYQQELREIVKHAKTRVPVIIIASSPSSVQSYLLQDGINMENITIYDIEYNSVWVRDYGPQSIYLEGTDELAFADWVYNRPRPDDNLVPNNLATELNIPIYRMTTSPNRLVATGGNFMADGHGTGFSSNLIENENPSLTDEQIDNIANSYLGIDRYVRMDELPYDNINHIDMHMKLLNEETILVGKFPDGVSDGPYIESNINYVLNNYPNCYGRDYEIVYVPMVPSSQGNYPPNSSYRTFTNSVILNDLVLVPIYNNSALNQQALAIYQEAMPGYEIIGINMENVIPASGAIHCITKEIAAVDPIFIAHAHLINPEISDIGYPVQATIKNAAGIATAEVFYKTTKMDEFTSLDMVKDGNEYSAIIPTQPCGEIVSYYISATNEFKTITKPLPGADGAWNFTTPGLAVDFAADLFSVKINEPVTFTYLGCLTDGQYATVEWNFGEGAQPQTHNSLNDVEVVYSSPGNKTISLTIDGEQLTFQNYILVSETPKFTLQVSKQGEGTTNPTIGTYLLDEGINVTISAEAAPGWIFEKWIVTTMENEVLLPMVDITINSDIEATAVFTPDFTYVDLWQNDFLFDIFPNPAQKGFNLVATPVKGNVVVEIYSITGQMVEHRIIKAEFLDQKFWFDMTENDKGVYFVKVSWDNSTQTRKLILN